MERADLAVDVVAGNSAAASERAQCRPVMLGYDGDLESWIRDVQAMHARALLAFLANLLSGDRSAAEDLAQEVFIRAIRQAPNLTGEIAELRSWLFTVGRRLVIDVVRARRARPFEVTWEPQVTELHVADHGDDIVARHSLLAALATLPPGQRLVIEDLYLRGLSIAESAEMRAIPPGTVKSRAHYALHQLRRAMSPEYEAISA